MTLITWNFGGAVMARACNKAEAIALIFELNMNRIPHATTKG